MQHVSSWVEDFDGAVARGRETGWVMIQEGRSAYGPFAYMEHPEDPRLVFEITRKGPERKSIFEQIAQAAVGWDGSDPIRSGKAGLSRAPDRQRRYLKNRYSSFDY